MTANTRGSEPLQQKSTGSGYRHISLLYVIDSIINFFVLMVILLVLAFAGYALWDSEQVHSQADKSHYTAYKPTAENEGKTFEDLRAINDEVIAWLTVFDTNIDYPVTQTKDNMKYVTTNAEGRYSLSGSIFLDYRNHADFSDFNSIVYGHNMDKKTMFGEIGLFEDAEYFDRHGYGNFYFDGKDHGIEFFAFIHTDAYNSDVFWPNVPEDLRQEYLDELRDIAINYRDIGVSVNDRIVLLATCSPSTTNGRDILVGRITDETYFITPIEPIPLPTSQSSLIVARPIHLVPFLLKILLAVMITYRAKRAFTPKSQKRRQL